jgi:hypothetical protein
MGGTRRGLRVDVTAMHCPQGTGEPYGRIHHTLSQSVHVIERVQLRERVKTMQ